MLGALGTVLVTGATMVTFDAAEFITFSTIGKKLKRSKGANPHMITVNDFIAQAKAKQAKAAQITTNAIEKVVETAKTAKEVVTAALPTSHAYVDKLMDQRTVEIMIVVEALRQEVHGQEVDVTAAVNAAQKFLATVKAPKVREEKAVPVQAEVIQSAAPAAQTTKATTKGKRKFDAPVDWSQAPMHGAQ